MAFQCVVPTHYFTSSQYHPCFLQGILSSDSSRALVTHNVNHTVTSPFTTVNPHVTYTRLSLPLLGEGDKEDVKKE